MLQQLHNNTTFVVVFYDRDQLAQAIQPPRLIFELQNQPPTSQEHVKVRALYLVNCSERDSLHLNCQI